MEDVIKDQKDYSMIIQHNILTINSYRDLGTSQSVLNKNLERLSSGYRINRTGDNAAGLTISESIGSQINGLNQAPANAKDVIGLTKTAEGALSGVHSMFQCITTLAEQTANGACSTVARGNIQEEYKALTKEVECIFENADSSGIKPLTTGKETTMAFQIDSTSGETITVDKEDIYGKAVTAAMSLKLSVQNDAKNVPRTIKTAIDDASTYRTKLGAAQSRLERIVKSLDIMSENVVEAKGRIRNTDIADEITAFTKSNILLQAARSILAQSNAAPQDILNLLQ